MRKVYTWVCLGISRVHKSDRVVEPSVESSRLRAEAALRLADALMLADAKLYDASKLANAKLVDALKLADEKLADASRLAEAKLAEALEVAEALRRSKG